jgi:dTDP-4-dehydrorhamnose reductase
MRINLLVTGASGFLGNTIVQQAAGDRRFHTVWGTRYSQRLQAPGVRPVHLDVTQPAVVRQLLGDILPQVVIHAAYSKRDDLLEPVTVQGTRHVAEAAAAIGARLIHVSSDLVLDGEHAPYDEAALPAPVHAYGRAKAAAETIVAAETPRAVIVRTSLICGLQPMDPVTNWIVTHLRTREGQPITLFTDELRTPVWVTDLAAALLELASTPTITGVINVAGPQWLSRYEMGVRLAQHFGLHTDNLLAGLSHDSGLVRPRDCRLDTSLARRLLQTPLRSFDQGLADAA